MVTLIHVDAFSIIGKERSRKDGKDFMSKVQEEILSHIKGSGEEKKQRFWGIMGDPSRSLKPLAKGHSKSLYLYGVEAKDGDKAPEGWVKREIPAHDYCVGEVGPNNYEKTYYSMLFYFIPVKGYKIIGDLLDLTDEQGKSYLYFPVVPNPILAKKEDLTIKIAPCGLHCGYCFFECGGCSSGNNMCSYGNSQPDHICPNVKCSKNKGLEGCYLCPELMGCKYGFYAMPGNAKASAIFISKHGKKTFEEATKKLLGQEKPYYELMVEQGDDAKQVAFLEKTLGL